MLPSKIKLLEKEYKIIEVVGIGETTDTIGQLVERHDLIEIIEFQSDTNKHLTLFHELIHAMFMQIGDETHNADEDLCDRLALGIYSLIKHNDFSFMKEVK